MLWRIDIQASLMLLLGLFVIFSTLIPTQQSVVQPLKTVAEFEAKAQKLLEAIPPCGETKTQLRAIEERREEIGNFLQLIQRSQYFYEMRILAREVQDHYWALDLVLKEKASALISEFLKSQKTIKSIQS